MGRAVEKLKALQVERLSKKPGLYNDGAGLCLRVTSPTARSWVLRYMLDGNAREMGLGSYPDISLADARGAASEARKLKGQGKDPIAMREAVRAQERVEAARAVTFRYCAEAYIAARKDGWKNAKHAAQWTATLETYAMPVIGNMPVQSVDVGMVHKILDPIWSDKTETASRVRGRIESILDWATVREFRRGDNPARWKGHLENLFPRRSKVQKVEHHPALPYAELGAFMGSLKTEEGIGALALQFTILTAARTGEVANAKWSEIDFDESVWTVPADRMKTGREHRVPLSKPALAILRKRHELRGKSKFVFPGSRDAKPISNMAMLQTLRRMGREDLTVHGFRSTFRDWAAEQTAFPSEVAEAALAHVVGDKVEAAYRRGDLFQKRRKLMISWATFCGRAPASAQVIQFRKRAR
jgi:integrase